MFEKSIENFEIGNKEIVNYDGGVDLLYSKEIM